MDSPIPVSRMNFEEEQRPCTDLTGKVRRLEKDYLGCGGMADVYEGILIDTNQPVAIKFIRGVHNDPQALKNTTRRINRETYIWQPLHHKNILKFLGVCRGIGPSPALISPLCAAGSVKMYVRDHPNVNRSLLILGIAEGLTYLHQKDVCVLHGDLKPSNILINENGDPLICDFGMSKIHEVRGFTTKAGSYRYMAPELILDSEPTISKASDVYSFGMVGFELLTNKMPFDGIEESAVIVRVTKGEHPFARNQTLIGSDATWSVLKDCWGGADSRIAMDAVVRRLPRK